MQEIGVPVPAGFPTFNDFFTRQLIDDARPVDRAAESLVSPVDGTVSAAGKIDSDMLLQAKGLHYSLSDLMMTDIDDAARFNNGVFATLYLAPHNYHRVHCPLNASLIAARYVPGALYSVNESTVSILPNLFTRNERLICRFDSDAGPMILIFVGALHVGSISTPWTGRIQPRRKGVVHDIDIGANEHPTSVNKGDLLGWFNMGSTVILLLPQGTAAWEETLARGSRVRMGERIGVRSGADLAQIRE